MVEAGSSAGWQYGQGRDVDPQPRGPLQIALLLELARLPREHVRQLAVPALRAQELVSLRTADVDHDGEQLRVEGKGRKTRFVPVGEPAMAAVRLYLERARPALARPGRTVRRSGRQPTADRFAPDGHVDRRS